MWAVPYLQGIKGDTGPAGLVGAKGDQVCAAHDQNNAKAKHIFMLHYCFSRVSKELQVSQAQQYVNTLLALWQLLQSLG